MNDTDQSPNGKFPTSSSSQRRRLGAIILLLAIGVGILFGVTALRGEPLQDVTEAMLDSAVDRWRSTAPNLSGYTATIDVQGPNPGVYKIEVVSGEVQSVSFRDSPLRLERTRDVWTVDGMLQMVELDLEKKQQLADSGNKTFVTRALFDYEFGYPRKYLRFDYFTKTTITWTVTSFKVRH